MTKRSGAFSFQECETKGVQVICVVVGVALVLADFKDLDESFGAEKVYKNLPNVLDEVKHLCLLRF